MLSCKILPVSSTFKSRYHTGTSFQYLSPHIHAYGPCFLKMCIDRIGKTVCLRFVVHLLPDTVDKPQEVKES